MDNCKHLVERKDKCSWCDVRGVAYCMLPIMDEYWLEADSCKDFQIKEGEVK